MKFLCWIGIHSWTWDKIPRQFAFYWFQGGVCKRCGLMTQRKVGWSVS